MALASAEAVVPPSICSALFDDRRSMLMCWLSRLGPPATGLDVGLIGRYDLIFFKLYAAADHASPGSVHARDLLALSPTREELDAAALLLDDLSGALREVTMEVVWRQWSALGGMTSSRRAKSLVDPEALVLMSLTLEPVEPRLGDLLADWAARNSDLLSVQRMRNLAERYPTAARERLGRFACIAYEEGKDHRWKRFCAAAAPPLALRRNKARAVRAQLIEPAALMLRLRLAFGVGIKADLLGFLLGVDDNAWASVSTIATATGYTIAAVRKAARDLAEARFIEEIAGTRTEYHAPHANWRPLLGLGDVARWRAWDERFVFVAAFLDWEAEARQRPITPYLIESRGRDLLQAYAATFRWHRIWPSQLKDRRVAEPDGFASAVRALVKWMKREV